MTNVTITPVNVPKGKAYSEYEIDKVNDHDPKIQLKKTIKPFSVFLNKTIRNLRGIKVNITLEIYLTIII